MLFKVKFFGAIREKHEQVRLIKKFIDAPDRSKVEAKLRDTYGVVNGLKIHEYKEE